MVSRRIVVRGAIAVGLLGTAGASLTGCGEERASAADPTPEPTGTIRPTANTAPPRTKSDVYPRNPEPRPPNSPPDAFARTSDIPVGGGRTYPEHKLVVTQPTAGTYRGFSATCTHTGCLVDEVANGQISCPCHGSRFAIADGQVEQGPALLPLPARAITVGADGSIRNG